MLVSDYKRRWCEIRLDTIVKLLIARSIFHDHYVGYKSNLNFKFIGMILYMPMIWKKSYIQIEPFCYVGTALLNPFDR